MQKINTILTNTTTKTTTIQTLTKALTNPYTNNKQTNTTTIKKHSIYHPQLPYTLIKGELTTLIEDKTASASRPRQKILNEYKLTNDWIPNTVTNHKPNYNTNTHFSTKQLANVIPAFPNLFNTTKFIITKYLKINKQKPKIIILKGYYFINKLTLLLCGDIEPNPGPMPNILQTHPATHRKEPKHISFQTR